jgi:hypothetical protein
VGWMNGVIKMGEWTAWWENNRLVSL